uniref:Uncharacterized protein n=1 Tax=Spongospora subterranea TaxID=70186 RepID=A0A0H5QLA8_9EUKA|eukprot:CRZ02915.1 hypothetical protein [Spongospora subterranea]
MYHSPLKSCQSAISLIIYIGLSKSFVMVLSGFLCFFGLNKYSFSITGFVLSLFQKFFQISIRGVLKFWPEQRKIDKSQRSYLLLFSTVWNGVISGPLPSSSGSTIALVDCAWTCSKVKFAPICCKYLSKFGYLRLNLRSHDLPVIQVSSSVRDANCFLWSLVVDLFSGVVCL